MNCAICNKVTKQVYSAPESKEIHCVTCGEKAWRAWEKEHNI